MWLARFHRRLGKFQLVSLGGAATLLFGAVGLYAGSVQVHMRLKGLTKGLLFKIHPIIYVADEELWKAHTGLCKVGQLYLRVGQGFLKGIQGLSGADLIV